MRTYNYPQNRVTDHRVGVTLPLREQVLAGHLEAFTEALRAQERQRRLEEQSDRAGAGMTPNPDLLRIEFLGITAHHDEVDMPREDLALFFAGLSGPYALTRLEYHSDAGATFSGPDGAECVLRPGQIASCGVTSLGYREGAGTRRRAARRRPSSATGSARSGWTTSTLVAVWDVEDRSPRASCWWAACSRWTRSALDLLGGDHVSLGLRIWRRAGDSALEVAIEPMHSEPSKVYIRLRPEPERADGRGLGRRGGRLRARLPPGPPEVVRARARPPLTD